MAGASVASSGIVHEVLRKDNYRNWSVLVRNYLLGRGLWDVVTHPEIDVKNETWRRENAKALHIIQLSCGPKILDEIRHFERAEDAWNHLGVAYGSESKASPDIEQGIADDSLLHNKQLHRYVQSGEWKYARAFINKDKAAIFSTSSLGRTILHVAVLTGHENIVEQLVKQGKDKLVKMQDILGYTALALAADLTDNTKIAKCMVNKRVGYDLLTMKTKDGQIPVLLAAAKGHKNMTRYLYDKTPEQALFESDGVLLLSRCITAEVFDVALKILRNNAGLPLTHESYGLQPLNALAHMPSAFPSGIGDGPLQQFFYNILKINAIKKDPIDGTPIEIVSPVAQDEVQKNLFAGRFRRLVSNFQRVKFLGIFCRLVSKFRPVKFLDEQLGYLHEFVQNRILLRFYGIREICHQKLTHHLVLEILICLRQRISAFDESQLQKASAYDAMLQAAKYGIVEFIDSMRQANPDLLWAIDKDKRGVFSHAVLNRREEVFNLLHRLNERKDIITSGVDVFGNTLLHLAGLLGPSSDLDRGSGATLRMQREIQWFKEMEEIVHPKCKEAKNADGKKPRDLFTENHEDMMKASEQWMKDTANSFMLVGTLITTIMFAAAFTVPGGNNQETGIPMFLRNNIFTVFIIADAISLFTSATSVLVFIGIVTSRYAEKDFLWILPFKLLIGFVALFLSVVSMMVAFCAALRMMLRGFSQLVIGAMSLATIPVTVLILSQLQLLHELLRPARSNAISFFK